MGITPIDIITYIAFVLGFVFLIIYLIICGARGWDWKGAISEAVKIFGFFVIGSIFFLLLLSIPNILRGCIIG